MGFFACCRQQILRNCDPVERVESAPLHQGPVSLPQIEISAVDILAPGMCVPIGKDEKETFDLYAPAGAEKLFQPGRPGRGQALKGSINDMEALRRRKLVEHLQDCALR